MNYTVVIHDFELRKKAENRINVAVRHCKIGKVREKIGIKWFDKALSGLTPPYRDTTGCPPIAPWMMPGSFCNQISS
jgi:hypothetical protein